MSTAVTGFTSITEQLIKAITESFQECTSTLAAYIKFKTAASDAKRASQIVDQWHEVMMTALPARVPYRAALQRIISTTPCLYHACAYHDADVVFTALQEYPLLKEMDMVQKYYDPSFTADDRKTFWMYIDRMNKFSLKHSKLQLPAAPSRDELEVEIKRHQKKIQSPEACMSTAFQAALENTTDIISAHPGKLVSKIDSLSDEGLLDKWTLAINNQDMEAIIVNKDVSRMQVLCWGELLPTIEIASEFWEIANDTVWKELRTTASLAKVKGAIPGNMMRCLEEHASKISRDIAQGNMSMQDLDMQQLGQQVLAECNIEDMSALANNVESLLPTLLALRQDLTVDK